MQEITLEQCTVDLKFEPTERYETYRKPLKSLNNNILIGAPKYLIGCCPGS
jgi:hypothetical protein